MEKLKFTNGIKDGLPICFAYLAVSFTFGIAAVQDGLSALLATLISATNITSAGQFAGLKMIAEGALFLEIGIAVFIINSRYMLMSLSLAQNIPQETKTLKRLVMSIFVTDEIFAVSHSKGKSVNFKYFLGLALTPYLGWTLGTLLGGLTDSLLPQSLQYAMGIALYCMFIAIIIPPAKKSIPITFCIGLSVILSCLFYYTPYLNRVNFGITVIICSLVSASVTAIAFPVKEKDL